MIYYGHFHFWDIWNEQRARLQHLNTEEASILNAWIILWPLSSTLSSDLKARNIHNPLRDTCKPRKCAAYSLLNDRRGGSRCRPKRFLVGCGGDYRNQKHGDTKARVPWKSRYISSWQGTNGSLATNLLSCFIHCFVVVRPQKHTDRAFTSYNIHIRKGCAHHLRQLR